MIPPEQDAEVVAAMEEVLETYARPYDAQQRVVDYEYERAGTAAVFMFCQPLSGWREATARERRTKLDWALEVAHLLEGRYAQCARITLVCDHLNTHTKGAFYEAFEPARAGPRFGAAHRVLLHTEARQLAEHRRTRAECDDAPELGRSPHRKPRCATG